MVASSSSAASRIFLSVVSENEQTTPVTSPASPRVARVLTASQRVPSPGHCSGMPDRGLPSSSVSTAGCIPCAVAPGWPQTHSCTADAAAPSKRTALPFSAATRPLASSITTPSSSASIRQRKSRSTRSSSAATRVSSRIARISSTLGCASAIAPRFSGRSGNAGNRCKHRPATRGKPLAVSRGEPVGRCSRERHQRAAPCTKAAVSSMISRWWPSHTWPPRS
jgi:hypothetical protein